MSEEIYYAGLLSFALSVCFALLLIPFLRRLKFGQSIRDCGPEMHLQKAGTPTMGGLIMLPAIVVAAVVFGQHDSNLFLALFLFVIHMAIGFTDDFIKVVLKRNLGLTAKQKLAAQFTAALLFVFFARGYGLNTVLEIPLLGFEVEVGYFYYILVFLLLLGTTNAVNLTDGLDGLAAGATVPVCIVYALISASLNMPSLAVFSMAMVGACLGFLLFNRKPAKVFMGDTGSLALGGGIAALALLTKTELLLVMIGGLYVLEALSVILQVISFKKTGKRIFRMSPLHHHYELGGWSEQKVVAVFWCVSFLFSLVGFLLFLYT